MISCKDHRSLEKHRLNAHPDLRYLPSNLTFYHPIQLRQSPIQLNITVYVAGKSGLLAGGLNNQQIVQFQTPQTANMTTFQAASVNPSIRIFELISIRIK